VFQRHAFQVVHGNERLAGLVVNLVDGADVRVAQSGSCLGFTLEASERLRISRHILGKELEGDKAAKFQILGLVHNPHASATQLLEDAVMRDGLSDHCAQMLLLATTASQLACAD